MKFAIQLSTFVAVALLLSACQSVYSMRVSDANLVTAPVVEVSVALDSVLGERGFHSVSTQDSDFKRSGILAEWQKLYKKDFTWGGGFIYVDERNDQKAVLISVSQTNGNPMQSLAKDIKMQLQDRLPRYTVLLVHHAYFNWNWAK